MFVVGYAHAHAHAHENHVHSTLAKKKKNTPLTHSRQTSQNMRVGH